MPGSIYEYENPLDVVRVAFETSERYQRKKFQEYQRLYDDYKCHQDLSGKDPYWAYPKTPLPYAIIESQVARDISVIFDRAPWIQIGAPAAYPDNAGYMKDFTDGLQCLLEAADFKQKLTMANKMRRLFGLAFLEISPTWEIRKVKETRVTQAGLVDEWQDVARFRLTVNAVPPWEIYRDPYATTMENCRWLIRVREVSRREIVKMANMGHFGDDFDSAKLTDVKYLDSKLSDTAHWGDKMRRGLGFTSTEADSDIVLWLQYESPERYIDCFDMRVICRDTPNRYAHQKINHLPLVNNYDPNPQMGFDGVAEMKTSEAMIATLDTAIAQFVNNHQINVHGTWLFREEAVSFDQLRAGPGSRISVRGLLPGQSLGDAVHQMPIQPMGVEHLNMIAKLEMLVRTAVGVWEQDEGRVAGASTATEAALLRQQSDSRKKMTISMLEWELKNIAELALSHMEQFMTTGDWGDVIGEARAQKMKYESPHAMQGGCVYLFNGADRATEALIRRREYVDAMSVLGPLPVLLRKWAETHNWSQDEVEEMMAYVQQRQATAEQTQAGEGENELQFTLAKKRVGGLVDTENKIREVAMGLRALPGDQKNKPVNMDKAKRS